MRERTDGPVPLLELAADPEIMAEVTGIPFGARPRAGPPSSAPSEASVASTALDAITAALAIALMDLSLAYSLTVGAGLRDGHSARAAGQDAGAARGHRPRARTGPPVWQDEHRGLITRTCRTDFRSLPWPSLDQISLLPVALCRDERCPTA